MTARAITLKGLNAGAYYTEQLPSYYLDAGEPRGVWFGDSAASLGLRGVVDDAALVNVIGGLDPTGSFVLGRRHGEESVRGFDVTFSAPKSVSVLWGLYDIDSGDALGPRPGYGDMTRADQYRQLHHDVRELAPARAPDHKIDMGIEM